jgi:hypothetical protein
VQDELHNSECPVNGEPQIRLKIIAIAALLSGRDSLAATVDSPAG